MERSSGAFSIWRSVSVGARHGNTWQGKKQCLRKSSVCGAILLHDQGVRHVAKALSCEDGVRRVYARKCIALSTRMLELFRV